MQTEPKRLQAGRVEFLLDGIELRRLCFDDHEILRRVHITLRGSDWETHELSDRHLELGESAEGYSATFSATHHTPDGSLRWSGRLAITDSNVRYQVRGEALDPITISRVGLCALFPLAMYRGRSYVATTDNGSNLAGLFPAEVATAPVAHGVQQALIPGFSRLRVELDPADLDLEFEGDLFEVEDQRNWADASFKAYCTPLSRPFPRVLAPATTVENALSLTIAPRSTNRPTRPPRVDVIDVEVGGPGEYPLPSIGIGLQTGPPIDARRLAEAITPSFLQLHTRPEMQLPDARQVADVVAAFDCELDVRVATPVPDNLVAILAELPHVVRLVAVGEGIGDLEDAGFVELARRFPSAALGIGTETYFVNLNRNRPDPSVEVVSWPIDPQAHASDDLSVMENAGSLADLVETARSFAPSATLSVGPILLGAASTGDPRRRTTFAAAWAVAALASLTKGGADAAAFFELTGSHRIADEQGALLPVGELLSVLAPLSGARTRSVTSSSPEEVGCLGVHANDRTLVIVANLTNRERTCMLGELGRGSLSWIPEENFGRHPASAHGRPDDRVFGESGRLSLDPFGVRIVSVSV